MVSARMGRRVASNSTAATFSPRWASWAVRGPMPGPISSTPTPGAAPEASAACWGTQDWMRKFCPLLLEK